MLLNLQTFLGRLTKIYRVRGLGVFAPHILGFEDICRHLFHPDLLAQLNVGLVIRDVGRDFAGALLKAPIAEKHGLLLQVGGTLIFTDLVHFVLVGIFRLVLDRRGGEHVRLVVVDCPYLRVLVPEPLAKVLALDVQNGFEFHLFFITGDFDSGQHKVESLLAKCQ